MGSSRRWGAAALAAALMLPSACATSDGEAEADPPASTPASGSPGGGNGAGEGATARPAADPAHAVEPPGPREGSIAPADILVTAGETISDGTVEAIRGLEGVLDVEVLSIAQVTIENEAIQVAAVDPATYRNFTPYPTPDAQDVWDRVAGGELALRPALEKKLPLDDADFLRLGVAEDASEIHVGAWAQQAVDVDAVVNRRWGDTLGMTPGNALLVRTGATVAPQPLRKPIQRLVAGEASVQMVDVMAREGLDPDARQIAVTVGSVAEAVGVFRYTVIGGGRIAPDPAWVRAHIATEEVPILGTVTCNKALFPQLRAALTEVVSRGLADEIHPDEYAGCYYPRFIAGSTTLSNHSFGLALDLNVPGNGRGTVGEIDRDVVAIFKSWGFAWGGDWRWTDPMHFEMDRIVEPSGP
ncbi:M15 family metallopeptidase [Nocardioides ferulae]|uniref:M15 family metallopeptidase n=1 Tax=Nocardioides ferulae TaxID=2340821 RepID=UPI000EAF0F6B|nr:M15 family metallopeptidase [Nocardioides ferulae]